MCIIASKPAGVDMPRDKYIENMFVNNPDGAGLMFAYNNRVYIEKGFMTLSAFKDKLAELDMLYGLKTLPLVMHFRITTHGGTKPENCHPFPVADSVGLLKKLKSNTDLGVAHNGIIDITPRKKDISDTMEYILSQLAPLKRGMPKFYENKALLEMIYNAIDSKMVFMNSKGNLVHIGDFREEDGIKYSNGSYSYEKKMFNFPYSICGYEDDYTIYDCADGNFKVKYLQWLDEDNGEYIRDQEGKPWQGPFAIDEKGMVYEYFYEENVFCPFMGAMAFDAKSYPLKYNKDSYFISEEMVIM